MRFLRVRLIDLNVGTCTDTPQLRKNICAVSALVSSKILTYYVAKTGYVVIIIINYRTGYVIRFYFAVKLFLVFLVKFQALLRFIVIDVIIHIQLYLVMYGYSFIHSTELDSCWSLITLTYLIYCVYDGIATTFTELAKAINLMSSLNTNCPLFVLLFQSRYRASIALQHSFQYYCFHQVYLQRTIQYRNFLFFRIYCTHLWYETESIKTTICYCAKPKCHCIGTTRPKYVLM